MISNRRKIVTTFAVVLLSVYVALAQNNSQPSFLIVLGDDISATSLGCFGADNKGTSPNIDKLAGQGILFRNMFVSEAICAPTRAELYTGLQPVRNGCFQNHKATYTGTKSVAHYLSDLGYKVGLTGKRHFSPASVYPFVDVKGLPKDCNMRHAAGEDWSGVENFISGDDGKPFCLFICSVHAHSPWDSGDSSPWKLDEIKLPPHFVDTHETRLQFREYLAEIRLFDEQVGHVMKLLEKHKLADNTILIVLDENGAGMPGGKWSNHDWGVRSACVMRWPGKIKSGSTTNAIAQYCDVLPTLIDAAGGKVPETLDGRSLLDLVQGKKEKHRDNAFFVYNNVPVGPAFPSRAVTDGKCKLIWNLCPDTIMVNHTINGFECGIEDNMLDRPERFIYLSWLDKAKEDADALKKVRRFRNPEEYQLYDLDEDPWELKNLAYDPNYETVVKELKSKIEKWMKEEGDPGKSIDVDYKSHL